MKVVFDQVTKNYGLITALKDISFFIDSGDFVFVAGPSGSGKSTLLKLILHQIHQTSGDIIIGDINLNTGSKRDIELIRRKTGVIFQDYQLLFDKTLEENIALALDIVSYPKEKIQTKLDEVIDCVGLSNRRFLFPSQLSGGELQRAALARALAVEPELILADEPTGNLDLENAWNLVKLLKQINENYHTTIIMTTHNPDIIESFNKNVLYLYHGELKEYPKKSPAPVKVKIKKKLKHDRV